MHTPGPWKRGITLNTRITRRWNKEEWKTNDAKEQRMIFANFLVKDEGRSRELIAIVNEIHPNYEDNARLIAASPSLYRACKMALDLLTNLTTKDFSKGKDAHVREVLADALNQADNKDA
jgi:hypothetical protein